MLAQHTVDDRQHVQPAEDNGRRNLQGAARLRVFAAGPPFGAVDVLQYLLAAFQIELALLGQAKRSRRAQKQGQTELVFELRHRAGNDRGRKLQTSSRFGEAPQLGDGNKNAHSAEAVHLYYLLNSNNDLSTSGIIAAVGPA